MREVAERIRLKMADAGYENPNQVAKAAEDQGATISRTAVYKIVNGDTEPRPDAVAAIAGILGCTTEELYGLPSRTGGLEPLARIGANEGEGSNACESFAEGFGRKWEEFYIDLSPLVATMFRNAYARHILREQRVRRRKQDPETPPLDPKARGIRAGELLQEGLMGDWWKYRDHQATPSDDPAFTDYAVARLHALMLAMPRR